MFRITENEKKLVAVVTPHVRFPLTEEDKVSLRHLRAYLGNYDRYLIGPQELPVGFDDFRLQKFPAKYFASINGYSRLLVSPGFYQAFKQYKYILIYQLDCLVFSSDLAHWCDKGWDYVGAPWMAAYPWIATSGYNEAEGFWWVGNGGLSLRNVESALKVLRSREYCVDPRRLSNRKHLARAPFWINKSIQILLTRLYALGYKNTIRHFLRNISRNDPFHEDHFWAFYAKKFYPDFIIPISQDAVHFSFECAPRYCFKATGQQLPFGCHAWAKYDRSFWEPYLLS